MAFGNADPRLNRTATVGRAQSGAAFDAGLRSYMLSVYNYMGIALVITGIVAYLVAQLSVVTNADGDIVQLTALGNTLFVSPLKWLVMLAPLGFVFFFSARLNKMSVSAAQATFWLFAAAMGLSLTTIFLVYTQQSIVSVFFMTAATFGAMSLYGYTTKRSLAGMGSFLFMGLIGIIIAMVVNIFLASSALQFAISVIGVLIFVGLTAYDTQRIKESYSVHMSGEMASKGAIHGALRLYLDFINLFVMLLSLFGNNR